MLGIFEKLDVDVMLDPSNVQHSHWIKFSKGAKKVIPNLFRRKDANSKKRFEVKKGHHSVLTQWSTSTIVMYLLQNVVG